MDTRHLRNLLKRLESEFVTDAAVAKELGIHRAHIHNFMSRKRKPSKVLIKSLQAKGYLPSLPKRIRSQITWESEEQKKQFQTYLEELGFYSVTEYCREKANETRDNRLIHKVWYDIWGS